MRILLLTPYYAPDLGPSAALYTMLCEDLVKLGHQVSVICAVPHYPSGRVAVEFAGRWIEREQHAGVQVTRVRVPSVDRSRLGLRLLSFVCYQMLAAAAGCFQKCDVVIASNPAFEIALPLFLLGFLRARPVVYSVHELYPDVGAAAGIFHHRPVIRLVDGLERYCAQRAARVRVLSESYARALEARGIAPDKLIVIGDWLDTEFLQPLPRQNAFARRTGLEGCFVVLYAGNLGPTQGLEFVLEAAERLTAQTDIRFVLVGEGTAKAGLEDLAQSMGLANVTFLPFQPRELLPEVLATADVSLLSLRQGLGAGSVPSKLHSILGSGRPVIAAVDADSETARLVGEARCGRVTAPGDAAALFRAVLELHGNEEGRQHMGENGRQFVVRFHSRQRAAESFEDLLCAIQNPPREPGAGRVAEGRTIFHG